jgi:hypothetical protein
MLVGSWKLGGEEVLGKENYMGKETPYFYTFLRRIKHMFHKLGLHWDVSFFFLFCKFLATLSIIRKVPEESKTLNQLETHCCQGSRSIWVSSSMMILYLVHP